MTWTAPSTGNPDSYIVQRATGADNTTDSEFAQVGTTNGTTRTFSDTGLVADTAYTYRVIAVLDDEESDERASNVAAAATPDTTAPAIATFAVLVNRDAGFADIADAGDVFVLHFSENVVLTNPALILTDQSATDRATVDSSNATFAVNGSVVTVTLTAALVDNSGNTAGNNQLRYDDTLVVANSTGIADAAGNRAVFAADNVLENDGAEFATASTGIYSAVVSATQIRLVFNEALVASSVQLTDFVVANGARQQASPWLRTARQSR